MRCEPLFVFARERLNPALRKQLICVLMDRFGHMVTASASESGRYGSFQRFEAAIEPRLHGGKRRAGEGGDFLQLHLFLEAQKQDFAVDRRDFLQRELYSAADLRAQ